MVKALIAGPDGDDVFDWMLHGFTLYERTLRARLDLSLTYAACNDFDELDQAIDSHQPDLLLFAFHWATEVDAAIEYLKKLKAQPGCPKLVFLDYYDPSSTPFFPILPYIDRYWKKQLLKPLARYNTEHWAGGNALAEMAHSINGVGVGDWNFGSQIPEGYSDRIELSWNLGSYRPIARFARHPWLNRLQRSSKKTIDVFCRVSLTDTSEAAPNNIYTVHRQHCLEAMAQLEPHYTVESNRDGSRVPYSTFKRQLRQARIAFSPWGWGEITDRDFRIVNAGALLMKPDMSHIQTDPDIYIAGETYVPVRWDLADLKDQCDYYLSRPSEIQRITENAYEAYQLFFKDEVIVRKIETLVASLFATETKRTRRSEPGDGNSLRLA